MPQLRNLRVDLEGKFNVYLLPSTHPPTHSPTHVYIHLSAYPRLSILLPTYHHLPMYSSVHPLKHSFSHLCMYLCTYLCMYVRMYVSIYPSICNVCMCSTYVVYVCLCLWCGKCICVCGVYICVYVCDVWYVVCVYVCTHAHYDVYIFVDARGQLPSLRYMYSRD